MFSLAGIPDFLNPPRGNGIPRSEVVHFLTPYSYHQLSFFYFGGQNLCSQGWPESHYIVPTDLEHMTILLLIPVSGGIRKMSHQNALKKCHAIFRSNYTISQPHPFQNVNGKEGR